MYMLYDLRREGLHGVAGQLQGGQVRREDAQPGYGIQGEAFVLAGLKANGWGKVGLVSLTTPNR